MRDFMVKKMSDSAMTLNESHDSNGYSHQVLQLTEVIAYLRSELNKDLPIQHIAMILAVVDQPGISMQALMEHLDMPQGSVSRNVKLLSNQGRGYDLLRTEQDEINRKQVVVHPTDKCLNLVENLCLLIKDEGLKEPTHVCRSSGAN